MLSFSLVFNNTKQSDIKRKSEQFFNMKYYKNNGILDAFQFDKNLSVTLYNCNLHFSIITKEEIEVRRTLDNILTFILKFFSNKTVGVHYYQNDFNIKLERKNGLKLIDF